MLDNMEEKRVRFNRRLPIDVLEDIVLFSLFLPNNLMDVLILFFFD